MRKKSIILTTTALLCSLSFTNTFAISDFDINKKMIDELLDRTYYDVDFEEYLIRQNADKSNYEVITMMSKDVIPEISNWYLIDSGLIFYDEILFSHPRIKSIYNEVKLSNPNNTIDENRYIVRTSLIASIENIETLLKESISSYSNPKNIFQSIFKRNPSQQELEWMDDIKTLKYAAYSGTLNKTTSEGTLTEDKINKIKAGEGYTLMNYDEQEYDILAILRQVEEAIQPHEIKYYKTYSEYYTIKTLIQYAFQINIYEVLSDNERLEIYNNSKLDLIVDYEVLFANTLKALLDKGLISEDDFEQAPPLEENPESPEHENPYEERNKYYEKNKEWYLLQQSLMGKYSRLFSNMSFKNTSGRFELCFKLNNKIYKTNIFLDNKQDIYKIREDILLKINSLLNGNYVKSKEKVMLQLNNNVIVYKQEEEKTNYLNYLNKNFKNIGLELILNEK